jgi:uncharacterized protein (DUF983 family)
VAVDNGGELEAAREILGLIKLRGKVVTADALHCIVVLMVAHIAGILFHFLFEPLGRDPLTMIAALIPICLVLCFAMLPSVKGGFIAFQWAKRMHGFGKQK